MEALCDRLAKSDALTSRQARDEFADAQVTIGLIPLKLDQLAAEMAQVNASLPELISPLRTELVEFVDAERAAAVKALVTGLEKLIGPNISAQRIENDASLDPATIARHLAWKLYLRFDREAALAEIHGLATAMETTQVGAANLMYIARGKCDHYRKAFKS